MKKKVLKVVAGATLMLAMVVGTLVNNANRNSDLASLMSIAVASGEVELEGCTTELGEACNNGTITAQDCDNSRWYEDDDCMYSF